MEIIAKRYEILETLGAGGMGKVYKARDLQNSQLVAIKQLHAELSQPEQIERFARESQALRDLNHPNIIKIYEAFQENDAHYLVMEYMPNGALTDKLKAGRLAIPEILKLAIDLADALTRAHKLNIIHRDLKPDNVLIAADGTLRLSDFGLAYFAKEGRLTQIDSIVGTIDYLAPEVFQGINSETRLDIWAFGVMLFELLAGEKPFRAPTVSQKIYEIMNAPLPDLESLRPDAPPALLDLVYRSLEREPNYRIASVRLIGAELEAIAEGRSSETVLRFNSDTQVILQNPHNLPAQTSPFVGREAELAELCRLLLDPSIRLLSILATGGMGKTRLSLAAAEMLLPEFPQGVYFVELAPYTSRNDIFPAIASAINFKASDANTLKASLLQYLGNKKLLLLLDNFEQLIEGAGLVSEILQAAPSVKILVTSRIRLQQAGESLFNLGGLEFPEWETPADALEYAAVQLFLQSAKRAQPQFEMSAENLPYLARICRLVGGMPLGIVLAAAWLALLSIEEVVTELQKSLDFLEAEGTEIPERQRSIRAVFEYAWQMMNSEEQALFQQLSYFRGGFSREAAQAITGASLRQLLALVNKALILRDVATGRYNIHELLRQYAAEKLAAEPALAQSLQDAHAHYYLDYFTSRTARIKGKDQARAREELRLERENFKQACLWGTERKFYAALSAAFEPFLIFSNTWYGQADAIPLWKNMENKLAPQAGEAISGIWARVRITFGNFEPALFDYAVNSQDDFLLGYYHDRLFNAHLSAGRLEEALAEAQKLLVVSERLGETYYRTFTMRNLATFYLLNGEIDAFWDYSRRAHKTSLAMDDFAGANMPLGNMAGVTASLLGDYPKAARLTLEVLEAIKTHKLTNYAWRYTSLGFIYLLLGELEKAAAIPDEAYQIALQNNDPQDIVMVGLLRVYLKLFAEDYEAVGQFIKNEFKAIPNAYMLNMADLALAIVATVQADDAQAKTHLQTCLKRMNIQRLPTVGTYQIALPIIAQIKLRAGQAEEAALIYAIAMQNPQSPVNFFKRLPFCQKLELALKSETTPEAYQAAWERGKTEAYLPILRAFAGA